MKAFVSPWLRRAIVTAVELSALLAATALMPQPAQAAFPDKPIRIVVPYTAGGGVDIITRLVSRKMSDVLKQTFIVDNRPGAATNIGMDMVARARADGYTLLTASNTLAANGALFSTLTFDPARDFTPVGAMGYAPLVVVVFAESPFKTLKDLIDYGRAHPDALTYASAGNGSSGHLASELLKAESGMKARHVPYKGGSQAITDLLGQRVSFMAINPIEVISHVKAGKLRALAVLDDTPAAMLPEAPTIVSQGLPGAMATVWWGLAGPKGLPPEVTEKLNSALQSALKDPEVKKRLGEMGAAVTPGAASQFGEFVAAETIQWTKVIKDAGVKAD